jgi:type IV fimbrial biogenesis protein FimT
MDKHIRAVMLRVSRAKCSKRLFAHLGFTLIELMVVIAIVAILVTFATPSFKRTMAQNAINSAISTLSSDINFARSEALKRGLSVTLCPTNSANDACEDTSEWQGGWLVFLDRDGSNSRSTTSADAETILRVQQNLPGGLIINQVSSAVKSIRFDRAGSPTNGRSLKINASGLTSSDQTETGRALCVTTVGRTRITAAGTQTC